MRNIKHLTLLLILLISCQKEYLKPSNLGTKFNSERKKVGLRIIDSTMSEIYGNGYDKINKMFNPIRLSKRGVNTAYGLKQPSFFYKSIFLEPNKGNLIFEEDVYTSSNNKITVDDFVNESLIYRYVFKQYFDKANLTSKYLFHNNKKMESGWQYIYIYPVPLSDKLNGVQYYVEQLDYITKKKADSILSSWQIKRLNY